MARYYYKLILRIINSILLRINAFAVGKLLAVKKKTSAVKPVLIDAYYKSVVRKQKFLISDTSNKLLIQHIIPSTYKNPFIHFSFLNVLIASLFRAKEPLLRLDRLFVWGNRWSVGYYHFVAEDLPKLLFMQNEGLPVYSWAMKQPPWMIELFSIFSIESKTVANDFFAEEICYITNNRVRNAQSSFSTIHPQLVIAMTKKLSQIAQCWSIKTGKKIIWLSRKYTYDRNIINEEECIVNMQKAGMEIEIIYPEKLTVKQQIMAVYHAAWIIGPHGAGLANIMFSSCANLIEIGPAKRINNSFISIAASLNRQYKYLAVTCVSRFFKQRSNLEIESIEDFTGQISKIVYS